MFVARRHRAWVAVACLASAGCEAAPAPGMAAADVALLPAQEASSDAYFAARPLDAQVGAWASDQSQPIATRAELERKVEQAARKVARMPQPLRPPYWGGYALRAERVELWVSRPARIHDRALWTRSLDTSAAPWTVVRLQP